MKIEVLLYLKIAIRKINYIIKKRNRYNNEKKD